LNNLADYFKVYTTTEIDIGTLSEIVKGLEEIKKTTRFGKVEVIIVDGEVTEVVVTMKKRLTS
jgi:hypothetical protein